MGGYHHVLVDELRARLAEEKRSEIAAAPEMVRRVATAICEVHCGRITDNELARCIGLARAAIEAMREPTFLMEMAGDCVVPFDFSIPSLVPERPTRALWQRMVDEALK